MGSIEKKKILLVDDVRLFLNLEETFFRRTGCQIFTAQNGEEALQIVKREKPHLVLLDLLMPGMSGEEVCKRIKQDPELKNTIVIMVSTQSDDETIRRCKEAGCDDYVTKPVHQPDLLRKAAEHLKVPYRAHFRILVRLEVEGKYEEGFFIGTSSDISQSGMLVETDRKLEVGERVNLQFVIPGQREPVSVNGTVARVDDISFRDRFGVGIKFEDLSAEQQQVITTFIESRKPKM